MVATAQPNFVVGAKNLKGPRGMRHFNFENLENLIDMKLYSLLILAKNTKKVKKQF